MTQNEKMRLQEAFFITLYQMEMELRKAATDGDGCNIAEIRSTIEWAVNSVVSPMNIFFAIQEQKEYSLIDKLQKDIEKLESRMKGNKNA